MTGRITLAQIAAHTAWLVVACNRCPRRGRLSVARLLREYGDDGPPGGLLETLSADCPRRIAPTWSERCGAHCPELPRWF